MNSWLRTLGVASVVFAIGCGDSSAEGGSGSNGESASETSDSDSNSTESSSSVSTGDGDGDGMSGDGDGDSGSGDGDGDPATGDGDGDSGSGDGDGDSGSGDGDGDSGDGDGDSGSGDGDGDGGTGDGDGDGGTGDGDGDEPDFCAKIDFLFVIDNSISMLPEQDALKAAFPGFIAAIENSLDTDDHILIADTDTIGWCTPGNCANPNNLHPTCEGQDGYACTMELEECDVTLGSGVVEPAGQEASNEFCDPFGGNRYIVEDEPNKDDTFACMASVGLAGNPVERPIDSIVQALSDPLNGPGGCNEGFLRDDAILVITFISDDDGNNEGNSPQQAYDAVVAAKNGDADRVVTLGLIPSPNNNCSFTPGAGEHWLEFIELFGVNGLDGPSCADDYVEFFQGAVDTIVSACEANPM